MDNRFDIRDAVMQEVEPSINEAVSETMQELLNYAKYEITVDQDGKNQAYLLAEFDKVTVSVTKTEGLNRQISFNLDALSESAANDFELYIDNAAKKVSG